jgi:leucyl aminopeptidase
MIQFIATSERLRKVISRQAGSANLIVPLFSGERLARQFKAANALVGGLIASRIAHDQFDASVEQCYVIDTDLSVANLDKFILVGLGSRSKLSPSKLRDRLTDTFEQARATASSEHLIFPISAADLPGLTVEHFAELLAECATLLDYEINHRKTRQLDESTHTRLQSLTVLCDAEHLPAVRQGLQLGQALGEATNRARDMVNEPSDIMTPRRLADIAQEIACSSNGLTSCRIHCKQEIEQLGMGGVLAVNQGSVDEALLIELSYDPPGGKTAAVIGLVGKGITFDSGGLGIKDGIDMQDMKNDMGGAAAVLSVMSLLPTLKPKVSVRAVVATTDNLVDARSFRPGKVLTTMSGLTVQVDHTDAEGRLTLADALHYVQAKCNASKVIDLATLTGAVEDALGDYVTGIFSNNSQFARQFLRAAEEAGELMHQLPMPQEYRQNNHSPMADLSNDGEGPGAIVAAWFLREFIRQGVAWIHADIGGTSFRKQARGCDPAGATGVGVRTLARFLMRYQ